MKIAQGNAWTSKADYNNAVQKEEDLYKEWKKAMGKRSKQADKYETLRVKLGLAGTQKKKWAVDFDRAKDELKSLDDELVKLSLRLAKASCTVRTTEQALAAFHKPRAPEDALWRKAISALGKLKIPLSSNSANAAALGIAISNSGNPTFSLFSSHRVVVEQGHQTTTNDTSFRNKENKNSRDTGVSNSPARSDNTSSSTRSVPSEVEILEASNNTSSMLLEEDAAAISASLRRKAEHEEGKAKQEELKARREAEAVELQNERMRLELEKTKRTQKSASSFL